MATLIAIELAAVIFLLLRFFDRQTEILHRLNEVDHHILHLTYMEKKAK